MAARISRNERAKVSIEPSMKVLLLHTQWRYRRWPIESEHVSAKLLQAKLLLFHGLPATGV